MADPGEHHSLLITDAALNYSLRLRDVSDFLFYFFSDPRVPIVLVSLGAPDFQRSLRLAELIVRPFLWRWALAREAGWQKRLLA